jgi:hypothetical protein
MARVWLHFAPRAMPGLKVDIIAWLFFAGACLFLAIVISPPVIVLPF